MSVRTPSRAESPLRHSPAPAPAGTRRTLRRELLIFVASAVLTVLVISTGTVLIVTQVAKTVALRGSEDTTARLAASVVGPLLGDVLAGDPARRAELDRAVTNRLRDGTLTGIRVWRADGDIIYASDANEIGRRLAPPRPVSTVINENSTVSYIGPAQPDGPSPSDDHQIHVYEPLQVAGQPPLAFEARFSYERVEYATQLLLRQILPLLLGALVVLQLVQVPIAVSLVRRVISQEAERSTLLERALSASERERRQIAADLHDGVIQDLAGVGYALAALSRSVPAERTADVEQLGTVVRGAVDGLRRMMVDIYPPELADGDLPGALEDMVVPLRQRGVAVLVEVDELPPLSPQLVTALYRVAREALNNVSKHARADTVQISLRTEDRPRGPGVLLRVVDDGTGLPADALDHRAEGHLGLHLLISRITELGGELRVHRGEQHGTSVQAWVPLR